MAMCNVCTVKSLYVRPKARKDEMSKDVLNIKMNAKSAYLNKILRNKILKNILLVSKYCTAYPVYFLCSEVYDY